MDNLNCTYNEFVEAKLDPTKFIPFHVQHNPLWETYAENMIKYIKDIMPIGFILDAEHIGSTSIPNTVARPCVAIDFAVESVDETRKHIDILYKDGWTLHTDKPDILALCKQNLKDNNLAAYQIIFMKKNHRYWIMKKAFRDYLRSHPDDAAEYSRIKLMAAEKVGINGGNAFEVPEYCIYHYTNLKARFVLDILRKCGDQFKGLYYTPISKFYGGIIDGEPTREPIEKIRTNNFVFMVSIGDIRKQVFLIFGRQMPGNFRLYGKCIFPIGGYYGQS